MQRGNFAADYEGGYHLSHQLTIPLSDEEVSHATLILRPSIEVAEQTVDIEEIWGEEIVFEGVEVWDPRHRDQPGW